MRNPTGSKAKMARPVARTILKGVFMSPQKGSVRKRPCADGRAERIPKAEKIRSSVERQKGKNPGPGSWSCPRGIREEETVPYKANTKMPQKLTRSAFMFNPRPSRNSSLTLIVGTLSWSYAGSERLLLVSPHGNYTLYNVHLKPFLVQK